MKRTAVRYQRVGRKASLNVKEVYPSEFGGNLRRSVGDPKAPAEDQEPRAINCFQCGMPIEDYADVNTCPLCGSDNMLGRKL